MEYERTLQETTEEKRGLMVRQEWPQVGWGNCGTRREKVKARRQEKLVQAENED